MSQKTIKSNQKLMIVNLDPGIDDAQAVLMALGDPNVKVLALCTHHGNTSIENATTNTLKMLTAINRNDIPVFRGCERALITHPEQGDDFFGKDGFGDSDGIPQPSETLLQSEHAVLAMIRLVNEYPGQITLLGLGPLTNLAMAHRLDPKFSMKIKDCFIMGGNYKGESESERELFSTPDLEGLQNGYRRCMFPIIRNGWCTTTVSAVNADFQAKGNITRTAEFNFYFDAEAANIVLSEFQCPISIITWELCLESALSWDVNKSLRSMSGVKAELMKKLETKLIEDWQSKGDYVICDELAMAAALDEKSMMESKQVSIEVECSGQLTRGQVVIDWANKTKKPKNVRLVTKMNMEIVKTLMQRAYLE